MGALRLYLALSVLFFHFKFVAPGALAAAFTDPAVAVDCFFVLSGFYMSLGLNERYVGRRANRVFYAGRFFRLWPTYLVSLLLMIPTDTARAFARLLRQAPAALAAFATVSNLAIVGLDALLHVSVVDGRTVFAEYGLDPAQNGAGLILNFPAWTLAVELVFYAVAPFVARSPGRCLGFLLVGLAYCLYFEHVDQVTTARVRVDLYFPYAMAYFGLGMLGYWLYRTRSLGGLAPYALTCAVVIAALAAGLFREPVIYVALALGAGALFTWTKDNALDKLFGDLAFPVYILHFPVGKLVERSGLVAPSALPVFIATMLCAFAAVRLIERPMERLRARLRRQRVGPSPPVPSPVGAG